MKLSFLAFFSAVAMALMVGCSSSASLELQFVPQDSAARPANVSSLELTRFVLQVREVKALPDGGNEDDEKYQAKGSFQLDLLDSANNTVPFPDAPAVVYKKVEFKIDKPDSGEGIDNTTSSVWLEGTADGIPFRFTTDKLDKITLTDESGADLQDGGSLVLLIDLDVPMWFDGVDLSTLEMDSSGVVVMEKDGMNKDAQKTVEENAKASIKLLKKS